MCSTVSLFTDISKAFDSVNYNLLLHCLWIAGERGVSHKWFSSYLDRKKCVKVKNNISSPVIISFSVL